MKVFVSLVFLSFFSTSAFSVMQNKKIAYNQGDTQLTGYAFWDDSFEGKRPAVVVFHEWWGLNDYALLRAEMLAEKGYVAFAADMYGNGKRTRHVKDAKSWMQQVTNDIALWQERAELGLQELLALEKVDSYKTAAIGYSFGGATVMQLAYSGVKLNGIISVHGSLPSASPEQAKTINPEVLVLHGASDDFVSKDQIEQFTTVLNEHNVNWEMDIYGRARHSFSNPYADGYGIPGIEFNEHAEQMSWDRTLSFLQQLFSEEHY